MPQDKYLDLEILIEKQDVHNYRAELRLQDPVSDMFEPPWRGRVDFSPDTLSQELLRLSDDEVAYGRFLRDALLVDPHLRSGLAKALDRARQKSLRLRLVVDKTAPELHAVHWEKLRELPDPTGEDRWLLANESLLFSRLLPNAGRHEVAAKPEDELRALVLIASPSDLVGKRAQQDGQAQEGWPLEPIDVKKERDLAERGLGKLVKAWLVSDPGNPGQASLSKLREALRQGFDIMYFVVHGGFLQREQGGYEPHLWLEGDTGQSDVVPGQVLIEVLSQLELPRPPRLIVLASCQSAGGDVRGRINSVDALAALGPRLASEVVPAVLAMQGSISIDTAGAFMRAFFQQLVEHGEIDRAAAAARGEVRDRVDRWMPVLYMSLRSARVWYVPGFGPAQDSFAWPALVSSIRNGRCTPVIGAGLVESLLGSSRTLARNWAERRLFPLAARHADDLPIVGQYLAISQDLAFVQDELKTHFRSALLERFKHQLTPEDQAAEFEDLLAAVSTIRRKQDPFEPYTILAKLPMRIYVNTNPGDLLAEALRAEGRKPQVEICRWNETLMDLPTAFEEGGNYDPSPERPLVYHLFGHISRPESLVLTEDDYFDFLMWISQAKVIPSVVEAAWARNTLLFLGFQTDDWNFRLLFRSILTEERRRRGPRERRQSVAVQINPEEGIAAPDRARRYLEAYFQNARVNSYWGKAEDFLRQLWERWQVEGGEEQR